ncbi:glycosyltransferase [Microbacterium sp. M]|uniref:glycosyltransferase n=1 Tax=Microbacterium sp. M TaxID=3377125 RepID=UPI00386974EE
MRAAVVTAARAALSVVPDRLLARILPGSLGWDPDQMQIARPRVSAPVRLLIAPVNSAGQAYRWARAAEERLGGVTASNLMTSNARTAAFGFPADVAVPDSGFIFAHGWQRRQRAAIVGEYTHVLLESGRFMYGSRPGRTPRQIADEVRAAGVNVGLLWHGTDIRVPSEHARAEQDSPFGVNGRYPEADVRILEENALKRRRMFEGSGMPVFVSTPGLLDVPGSQWLPVVVEPDVWQSAEPPLQRERPVVAYAPSNSPMKGDPSLDDQLRALETQGLIEYRRVEGVPSQAMPHLYRNADIVLDQFRLGDYGVAACEAMAAGRIVIGHVSDEVRARVLRITGVELPIVESRFSDVGEVIEDVLSDREPWISRADRGPEFVRAVHDGAQSARVLAPFLGA